MLVFYGDGVGSVVSDKRSSHGAGYDSILLSSKHTTIWIEEERYVEIDPQLFNMMHLEYYLSIICSTHIHHGHFPKRMRIRVNWKTATTDTI